MDDFRKATLNQVGIGGRHCPCCYDFHGSNGKRLLRRIARAKMKHNFKRDLINDR